MIMELSVKTPMKEVFIDSVKVNVQNRDIVITWNESEYRRTKDGFEAKMRGLYFDDEYSNGRILDTYDFVVDSVTVYSESDVPEQIVIDSIWFADGKNCYGCALAQIVPASRVELLED